MFFARYSSFYKYAYHFIDDEAFVQMRPGNDIINFGTGIINFR